MDSQLAMIICEIWRWMDVRKECYGIGFTGRHGEEELTSDKGTAEKFKSGGDTSIVGK